MFLEILNNGTKVKQRFLRKDYIDPEIRCVVLLLNKFDINTSYCCIGHNIYTPKLTVGIEKDKTEYTGDYEKSMKTGGYISFDNSSPGLLENFLDIIREKYLKEIMIYDNRVIYYTQHYDESDINKNKSIEFYVLKHQLRFIEILDDCIQIYIERYIKYYDNFSLYDISKKIDRINKIHH